MKPYVDNLDSDYWTTDGEAAKWCRKAADRGDAQGQSVLCEAYFDGKGVPSNFPESAKWCRKAADQGEAKGQLYLAMLYEQGIGVLQDNVLALMWLNLAGVQLGDVEKGRTELTAKMTSEQIAEAQRLAREWKPRSEGPKSLLERLMGAARQYFNADGSSHP
jgi:hypothetical protein